MGDVHIEETSAESWLKKGDKLFQQKKFEEALESYLNATDIDPDIAVAWHNMGLICQILKQTDDAITCFDKSRKAYQKAAIGSLTEEKSVTPEEMIARETPEIPSAEDQEELYLTGIRMSRNGHLDDALGIFEQLTSLNPHDCRVWNSKGITLAKLGRYQEADNSFHHAIIINPSYQPAKNNLNKLQQILCFSDPDDAEQSEEPVQQSKDTGKKEI